VLSAATSANELKTCVRSLSLSLSLSLSNSYIYAGVRACVWVVATHANNMCVYHILARLTLNGTSFIEKLQGVLYITSMNLPTSLWEV
jgi:hypothetical protein